MEFARSVRVPLHGSVELAALGSRSDLADAAGVLLDALTPRRVRLFVTETTSVNGNRLALRLTASDAQATVARYEPDRFVRAKLVGVTAGRRA